MVHADAAACDKLNTSVHLLCFLVNNQKNNQIKSPVSSGDWHGKFNKLSSMKWRTAASLFLLNMQDMAIQLPPEPAQRHCCPERLCVYIIRKWRASPGVYDCVGDSTLRQFFTAVNKALHCSIFNINDVFNRANLALSCMWCFALALNVCPMLHRDPWRHVLCMFSCIFVEMKVTRSLN